ncbi:MAG TPA: hypothetical protein VMI31_13950 [Fimbriimonadaceae bacterium]|nr:hypothetical protein [Fimbriimonadaceae bacterium]
MKNLLLFLALLVPMTSFAQAGTPFARAYKLGEKTTYHVTHVVKFMGTHSMSIDIQLTAAKLLDKGRAELGVHWSNLQKDADDETAMPNDFSFKTAANNLPDHFAITQGSTTFYALFLMLASATADKPVTVGDEIPINWDGADGNLAFKGTIKILEISAEKKRLKALVKVKTTLGGQDAGEFALTSTYDTTDGSLVQSVGAFTVAGNAQEFTFTRKS